MIHVEGTARAFGFLIAGVGDNQPLAEKLESAAEYSITPDRISTISLTSAELHELIKIAYQGIDVAADMADESLADLRPVCNLYCACVEASARHHATQPAAMHPDQV